MFCLYVPIGIKVQILKLCNDDFNVILKELDIFRLINTINCNLHQINYHKHNHRSRDQEKLK